MHNSQSNNISDYLIVVSFLHLLRNDIIIDFVWIVQTPKQLILIAREIKKTFVAKYKIPNCNAHLATSSLPN